jgi:preprotein translocase subunit YajC
VQQTLSKEVEMESLILVVLLGGMLLLMFNRTRRQQREAQTLQATLTTGSRVMTTAGLFATVVALDDSTVTLETAPGQRSRWDRRAIARVVPDDDAALAAPGADAVTTTGTTAAEPADEPSLLAEPGIDPDPVVRPAEGTAKDAAPPDRA